jgi:hypothetical protein
LFRNVCIIIMTDFNTEGLYFHSHCTLF